MTLDEIARNLGVSKSTVSRALSGKGRIGKKTRETIIAYAKENGINKQYDFINETQNGTIGVVLPIDIYTNETPYFHECLLGICEAASLLDYNVLVSMNTNVDIERLKKAVERKEVSGLIFTRNFEENRVLLEFETMKTPIAITGLCSNDKIIQVDTDNKAAAERLITIMIQQGFRKFAFVLDNVTYMVNKSRYEGVCNAFLKNGIARDDQCFYIGKFKQEMVRTVISDIISKKIECVICGDDVICTRIMSGLQAEGYRIPKDIAIASLCNSSSLECFSPAITAVNVSARLVGNTAANQLIRYINGAKYDTRTMVEYEILIRKSTKR